MRPVLLEFTAFGSYPGTETIDFTALDDLGLYVVTGPTGSGKTTIFDAMAFALYGDVPGAREASDIRSQHAPLGVRCSVMFRFEVDDITYRVERTPDQLKPRSKGTGDPVKDSASAELVRESDGEALESGPRAVSKRCAELLGLELAQFERVVLLPQGQFQRFLLSTSDERLKLLRALFGTAKWDVVVERLKERARTASAEVDELLTELDHHRRNAVSNLDSFDALLAGDQIDPTTPGADDSFQGPDADGADDAPEVGTDDAATSDLGSIAVRLDAARVALEPGAGEAERAAGIASEAETIATRSQHDAGRFDRRTQLRDRRNRLEDRREIVEASRGRLALHDDAVPVLSAAATVERVRTELADAESERDAVAFDLRDRLEQIGLDPTLDGATLVEALRLETDLLTTRRDAIDELTSSADALAAVDAATAEAEAERSALDAEAVVIDARRAEIAPLLDASSTLAASLPEAERAVADREQRVELRRELDGSVERLDGLLRAKDDASMAQRDTLARYIGATAPRLAASLVDGEPCAVCGSPNHPVPAVGGADEVTADELETANDRANAAASDYDAATRRIIERREALGDDATRDVIELDALLAAAIDARDGATRAADEVVEFHRELDAGEDRRRAIDERVRVILGGDAVRAAERIRHEGELAAARSALGADLDRALDDPTALVADLDERSGRLAEVTGERARLEVLGTAVATRRGIVAEREDDLRTALDASTHPSLDSALGARIDDGELGELRSSVAQFDSDWNEVDTALQELTREPIPEVRPDVEALSAQATELRAEATRLGDAISRMRERLEQADADLSEARRIDDDSGDVIERARRAKELFETTNGANRDRITLETWVLAAQLDRVTIAANHHLVAMSGGRYRIERSDVRERGRRKGGLDLVVFDSHTGQSRRPASLSGGEQFQASLALALGLAEVISLGGAGGGRVIESLFVDEGFGSLDPDSLQQAVDALSELRSGGRTVGVITHVESMKDSLPLGIRVERLGDGRGSTLEVLPNS